MRILSVDGGGIRGVIPATILAYVEAKLQKRIIDMFELVAGTSTGAIIACCLAKGMSAKKIVELYRYDGPRIFRRTWRSRLFDHMGLSKPLYPAEGVESVLGDHLGETPLSKVRIPILVPAHDMALGRDVFFKSSDPEMAEVRLSTVARCSSAAPYYFPAKGGLVDGGVFANNPSDCAIIEAMKTQPLSGIRVLSLGTGAPPVKTWPQEAGLLAVAAHMSEIFMDAGAEAVDHKCRALIGPRYVRINPDLGTVSPKMDDASKSHIDALSLCLKPDHLDAALEFVGK